MRTDQPLLILPAAGKGTRMAGLTGGSPKELLPLGGRVVMDWVADEAPDALLGVVGSGSKPEIRDWAEGCGAEYEEQGSPNGFAPAIQPFLAWGRTTLLALPDAAYLPQSPLARLLAEVESGADLVIAVEEIGLEKIGQYGICLISGGALERVVEKPKTWEHRPIWAVAARYAFSGKAAEWMADYIAENLPATGELSMTPVFNAALEAGFSGKVLPLTSDENRLDCGDPMGYQSATVFVSQLAIEEGGPT